MTCADATPSGTGQWVQIMMLIRRSLIAAAASLILVADSIAMANPAKMVPIWPGPPPRTQTWTGPEQQVDAQLPNIGKVHIVTNVRVPTLTIFPAPKPNGTAMVVLPGGAFRALPWDLDGLEPARWLTAHGITAFVLKYRVRPPASGSQGDTLEEFARSTEAARAIALADAQQAVRFVRAHARQYGVRPHSIGMIGFSAGAMTTVAAALGADPDARPDFAASLYGAMLSPGTVSATAPPLFIAAAQDDPQLPASNSADLFERWTAAHRPAELHLYEKGGHGFGFRAHHLPVDRWPDAFEVWLQARGYLGR